MYQLTFFVFIVAQVFYTDDLYGKKHVLYTCLLKHKLCLCVAGKYCLPRLQFLLNFNAVCFWTFQLLKHRMAHLKTEIAVGRAFVDSCIERQQDKTLDTATASMAKAW